MFYGLFIKKNGENKIFIAIFFRFFNSFLNRVVKISRYKAFSSRKQQGMYLGFDKGLLSRVYVYVRTSLVAAIWSTARVLLLSFNEIRHKYNFILISGNSLSRIYFYINGNS